MNEVLQRIKDHSLIAKLKGYEVVGVFLQGSQNYKLEYSGSDIDSKAIILPNFDDFVWSKKPVSTTCILDNDEHIDLKDIRPMFECFKKQNINFVEILFTDYKFMNPRYADLFQPMFDHREKIARYHNYKAINCMAGMSYEKYKALEHPYPSIVDKIEKYHYDPKQLHHILRLKEFIKRYIAGEKYADCLISKKTDYLIEVKKGLHTVEEAREIAKDSVDEIRQIKDDYMDNNEVMINRDVEEIMDNVMLNIMKRKFRLDIFDNE